MRRAIRFTCAVAAVLTLAPAAFAGTVTGLAVTGGNTHPLSAGKITLAGGADFTGDELGRTQVFTDDTSDGEVLVEATPPYQDLTAGYITETAGSLAFTWEVVDLPDLPNGIGIPLVLVFYWDFSLRRPGALAPVSFQITASFDARGRGVGDLASSCALDPNTGFTTCTSVPSAGVTVAYDGPSESVTATIAKNKLIDYNGNRLPQAVEGATLQEEDLFQGIGAYTSFVAIISGVMADLADMDAAYGLGKHVEAVLAPPGFSDEDLGLLFPGTTAPAGSGSYTVNVPLFEAGTFDAAVRACTGGQCGPPVRQPVTIT